MTNKIIIDGWNVCWKIPEISRLIPEKLETARTRFNLLVQQHFTGKNVIYKIVYDGQPFIYNKNVSQETNVVFSKNPEKADDLIIKFLQKQHNASNWTVITSDRQLSYKIKNLGAEILNAESFINKLTRIKMKFRHDDRKDTPSMKPEDISYWLYKFNSED